MWQVIGQEKALTLLKRSLAEDNLAHAYLLVGPSHIGKMTLAKNLAQALNCLEDEPPCGQCSSCVRISRGCHADVQVLSLKSKTNEKGKSNVEIGIDDIRDVQHVANLPPFEGKTKVFIIDGAENMSTEASNCILKILEEPPTKVVFLLLTSEEDQLLPTIVSRCQRIELKPLPAAEVKKVLIEMYEVIPDKADVLSRLSGGCLGLALEALSNGDWNKEREQCVDGVISLLVGSWEERFACAAELAKLFDRERRAGEERIKFWVAWWRDLLLVKAGCGEMVVNIDYLTALEEVAKQLDIAEIIDFTTRLEMSLEQIQQNVNSRLVLEALMLDMPNLTNIEKGQECQK